MSRHTFSSEVTSIVLFGPHATKVEATMNDLVAECKQKGIERNGPVTPPQQYIGQDHEAVAEPGTGLLYGQPATEEELDAVTNQRVCRHQLRIYQGDTLVRSLASRQLPEDVFIRLEVGLREHQKGGKNAPHTYDPNLDYVTDP